MFRHWEVMICVTATVLKIHKLVQQHHKICDNLQHTLSNTQKKIQGLRDTLRNEAVIKAKDNIIL